MAQDPSRNKGRCVGPFELLEKVGQGGMSTVYKACDTRSGAIVAVKVAARVVISDPHLSRRFELEYALVKPLKHPHLVRVLEYGSHEKIPFLVMEYVDGPSLAKLVKDAGKLSEHDALPIVLQIAEALAYLHKKQIVHRDIKPGNILLTSTGAAKLADLGLVKNLESLSRLTRSHMGLGTMHFASPEQFEDARDADGRSDIYSLAATLYSMLLGEPPFGGGGVVSVLQRKMKNEFEAPLGKLPELRPSVDAAIRLALHVDRDKRPATCDDFISLLTGEKKVPADMNLPGIVMTTKARSKSANRKEDERRGGVRYEIEFDAKFRPVANAQRWPSTVRDMSTTGVCLSAKRRFEVGSVLEITFAAAGEESAVNQLARIRWLKAADAGAWLLGCEFVNPLAVEELDAVCNSYLDRTSASRKP